MDKLKIEYVPIDSIEPYPDNASVQAARRMAEKKGYDWKTGKKLKK